MILLIGGLIAAVFLVNQKTNLFSFASPLTIPQNISISNLSDNSFAISWVTPQKATIGFVNYGQSDSLGNTVIDDRDRSAPSPRFTHHVTINNLSPATAYYYKISSAGDTFGDREKAFIQTTAPIVNTTPPLPEPLVGSVKTKAGKAAEEGLVLIAFGEGTLLSTYTRTDGNWLVTLNNARTKNLDDYLLSQKGDPLVVYIDTGPEGSVKVDTKIGDEAALNNLILENSKTEVKPIGFLGQVGDVNGDGVINVLDYILGLKDKLFIR